MAKISSPYSSPPEASTKKRGRPKKNRKLIRERWPRIYRVKNHGVEMFMVDARKSHFPRSRRTFYQTEQETLAVAEELARELANHGVRAFADLSGAQRKDAVEALEILAPFEGMTLLKATQHFAEYKAAEKKRLTGPTVAEALSAYLETKIADYKANRIKKISLYDIQSKSRYIEVGLGKLRVSEIDEAKAKAFLNGLRLRPRGRENVRLKLSQFLNFCITRKWITENSVGKLSEKFPTTDVDITSKTKETRFVTLESILTEWLLPFRKSKAPIVGKNFTRNLRSPLESIRSGSAILPTLRPWRAGFTWRSFWICSAAKWWVGNWERAWKQT